MLRSRVIRPGIVTNEDLCGLGPYAYILFTGLWMMADREGRLEDRPQRIKATVMPLWDALGWQAVDNLVEKLAAAGFVQRYVVGDRHYIQIITWSSHQKPNTREVASKIPPPTPASPPESDTLTVAQSRTRKIMPKHDLDRLATSACYTGPVGGVFRSLVEDANVENPPAPPEKPTEKPTRKPPVGGPSPEDFSLMKDSLEGLAGEVRLPPPDSDMIRRILAAGNGAPAIEVHRTLVALYKQGKFDGIHSWGLIPIVLARYFVRVPQHTKHADTG